MLGREIGFRKCRTSAVTMLGFVAVAAAAGASACANTPVDPVASTVRFKLDFGSNVTLSSVDYVLTRANSGFSRTGSLSVGDDPIVTATFQNLPPGKDYTIVVSGTASDGVSTCQGQVTFSVMPSMTTILEIPLTCSGLAGITATFNMCPVIDSLSAIPSEVVVGSSIQLTALAHDPDAGPAPLSAAWTADGGALSTLSPTGATFTCTAPGTFHVGLQISDSDGINGCADASTLTLICSPALSTALPIRSGRSRLREGSV
jgi:hypothetical protein